MKSELEGLVGSDAVSERPVTDLWPLGVIRRRAGQAPPSVVVVRPPTSEAVAGVLAWAAAAGVPVVPVGAGCGVCGAVEVDTGQLALDLTGLDRILEVDPTNLVCRVEAGVNGLGLEEHLEGLGLTLGHFPASLPTTTIGGLVSTRSAGQESTRYGNIEDLVLGLRVALSSGVVLEPRPGPRSAVGPALHGLWIGAEGALGVVLEACLRVSARPPTVFGGGWEAPSVAEGLERMRLVMRAGIRPLVMRLYDHEDSAFQGAAVEGCLLILALAGEAEVVEGETAVITRLLEGCRPLGREPWARWQRHRFDLSASRLGTLLEPPNSFLDTIEVGAPWTELAQLHLEVKDALAPIGLALCHFSHPYPQGCCAYFTFAGAASTEADAQRAYQAGWDVTMKAARRAGATVSHHHGVGQVRAMWAREEMSGWREVWDSIRLALDPSGVMNPRAVGGR